MCPRALSVGPPNGSRLSCGRLARQRKGVGRSPCPARAQHSDSFKAITARQLQALVRLRGLLLELDAARDVLHALAMLLGLPEAFLLSLCTPGLPLGD